MPFVAGDMHHIKIHYQHNILEMCENRKKLSTIPEELTLQNRGLLHTNVINSPKFQLLGFAGSLEESFYETCKCTGYVSSAIDHPTELVNHLLLVSHSFDSKVYHPDDDSRLCLYWYRNWGCQPQYTYRKQQTN